MIIIITVAVLLLGVTDRAVSYEQLAIDHFFAHTWSQEYKDYKSIEFENQTSTAYGGHVYGCREWDEVIKGAIAKAQAEAPIKIQARTADFSIRKRTNSRRLKLSLGNAIAVETFNVVQIDVYKPLEFVHH